MQQIPYYGTNDVVDIHANTLGIINDLTSYTQRSVAAFEINSEIVSEPFMDRFNNGLAGWVATFTLTTHNDRPICIWDLLPSTTTTTAGPTTTTTAGPTTTTTTAAPTTTTTSTTSTTSTTTTTTTAAPTTTTTTIAFSSWSAKYNGNDLLPEVCTQPTNTVYTISSPTLFVGMQIYLDSALTIPFPAGPGGLANYIFFEGPGVTLALDVNGVITSQVQIGTCP
jgi:hypothetical protein